MGGWPDNPVTCPECDGEGKSLPPIALVILGDCDDSPTRCDLCHGLGRIEQREADAWARSHGPCSAEEAAEIEASNRYYHWGK